VVFLRKYSLILILGLAYIGLSSYLIWNELEYLSLLSIGLLALFFAVFYTKSTFLAIAFLTPLSVNIEEFTTSLGLFIPTEPLLFGIMLLLLMQHIQKPIFPKDLWKNPIIRAVSFYVFWVTITAITSSHPLVSFKFLLARLWFLVPLLLYGPVVFEKIRNIRAFLWLFCIGMILVMSYTLIIHASYSFGEKEGHWVMWPFFKDHTIYGAMVAFTVPLLVGIYFSKKHQALIQALLIAFIFINFVALYFSYTRAAWLSIIAAMGVWALIHFKIKFSLIAAVTLVSALVLFLSWDTIQMEMARNKNEHTTEEFGERLQSATNVTTDASNLERLNRWTSAYRMFQERPLVGFGPGTYAFEYARFQDPEKLTIISTNFGDVGNAHSEYLGPLSEMGLIGMLSILFIVSAIFYKGINLYHNWPPEQTELKILILVMILSLVTYFVHGLLNNYLDTDKASVPIWGFCAIFIALEIRLNKEKV
jgi:putative inorganic carbon (HCO3(-)) transporter